MKRFLLALLVSFWTLLPAIGAAQTTTPNRGLAIPPGAIPGSWGADYNNNFIELDLSKIPRVTNATKPAKPEPNEVVVVTDALNNTTCTTGGGSSNNTCQWTGSTWVIIGGGGGGGGGGGFDAISSGTNSSAKMVVGSGASLATSGSGTIAATTATSVPVAGIVGVLTDAQIPNLNILSTGLTANRCVETDSSGNLSVTAGACGVGGGGGGSGTVTSVGFSAPTQFSVAGSPVTLSGTLALSWNVQTANQILSGPTTGAAAAPTFRTLVAADIPALSYQPVDAELTCLATTASAANKVPYYTGPGTCTTADYTALARSIDALTTLTNHGVLLGQGALAPVATGAGTAGQVLTSGGAAADPTFQSLSAASIAFTPTGTISSPTVAGAIAEVAIEAQPAAPGLTNFAGIACTGGIYATAVNTYGCRTPTSTNTAVLTITNADGIAGAPAYAITNPFIDGSSHFAIDAGSTDLYIACPASISSMATPAYIRGSYAILWPNTANTGPAQVNFCSLGARDIVKLVGGAGTALVTGDINVGQPLLMVYDAPNSRYQVLSTLGSVPTASAPGSTNQVPYNVGGVLTASTGLSFDPATNRLTVTGGVTAGDCTTNCTTQNETATGLNVANWAISGAVTYDIAGTTGTKTSGDATKFDAQGRIIRAGTANKLIQFMIGAENGAALVDADDQPSIFYNHYGQGITINDIWCETDAGTSTINLQRDDGSPANILTSNLVCSTTGVSSSTFSGTENQIASTNRIDFLMVTAATSGTPKRVSVSIRYTLD